MFHLIIGLALLPFAIVGLIMLIAGAWYLRWFIAAVVVGLTILLVGFYRQQSQEAQKGRESNVPLYQKCVDTVNSNATKLYNEAVQQGRATQAYVNELNAAQRSAQTKCATRYPTY